MKITNKKVTELIPYVNNSRTHSDEQVAQIAASIKEFGCVKQAMVDSLDTAAVRHRPSRSNLTEIEETA